MPTHRMHHHSKYDHPGDIIAARRQELHLTQTDLSKLLGYNHPNFISVIEAKKSVVPPERVPEFCKALELDPLWLYEMILRSKDRDAPGKNCQLADLIFDPDRMEKYAHKKREKALAV